VAYSNFASLVRFARYSTASITHGQQTVKTGRENIVDLTLSREKLVFMRLALVSCSDAMCTKLVVLTAYGPPGLCLRSRDDLGVNSFLGVQLARLFFFGVTVSALRIILCKTVSQHHHRSASRIWHSWHCCNTIKRSPIDCGATIVVSRLDMDNWVDAAINDASTSITLLFCKRDTLTHTRLTALFRD